MSSGTPAPAEGGRRGSRLWSAVWHRPESPTNLAAARVLLAATALWIVLSRFDLPSILTLPQEFLDFVTPARRARFFLVLGPTVDRILYALLHLSLAATIMGCWPRVAAFSSGLLLYHFAPFETIIWTTNPYLRGFTIPALGLLILSFSSAGNAGRLWPRRRTGETPGAGPSGWPLRLIQLLFTQIYFFSGYAKLFWSGPAWVTGENIRGWLLVLDQQVLGTPSLATTLAGYPLVCLVMAWAGIGLDLAFPLVLVSRVARLVMVPLAFLFHVANAALFHIYFQNTTLLLLFVDWHSLFSGVGLRGGHRPGGSPSPAHRVETCRSTI